MHHNSKFCPNRSMRCGNIVISQFSISLQLTIWSAELWSAFYLHVRTYGPQISVRILLVDGPQVCILHVTYNHRAELWQSVISDVSDQSPLYGLW